MIKFLEKLISKEAHSKDIDEQDLKVATAGLFIEMVYADFDVHPEEEKQLFKALHTLFNLSGTEVQELIDEARETREERHDIWRFASVLKDHLSREQRLKILTNLWQIVYADGRIDKYEDALMRKITNLLGLDHSEMIETKLAVKNRFEE
ncbi:tellurite resistance TerB family protein [Caldithrix abyssi]